MTDFSEVNRAAPGALHYPVAKRLPKTKREGREYVRFNPHRADRLLPSQAGQYVMFRYRVALQSAEVIAALAGFGGSEER